MIPASLIHYFRKSGLTRRFTVISMMFLTVLLGLLAYNFITLQKNKSNALLIDIAGRQRMLLQRHINEVFLTSQGIPTGYLSTRQLMNSTLNSLMNGGLVVVNSETNLRQTIPAAPTKEIYEKLRIQQTHIKHISQFADHFLSLEPDPQNFQQQLKILRTQNSLAIRTADEAVKQLDEYSEATISTMLKWEVFLAIFVGFMGIFATRKVIQDGHNLEREVEERKATEQSLQEWQALTESMLGQLPRGFAYRCHNNKIWSIIYISDGIEDVTGYPVSDFRNGSMTYDTLMLPGENDRVWPLIQDALAKNLPYENEHQIITKDGGKKWILARGRFVFNDKGELLYLDGLNVDITEYKRIENELRSSEARFRSLVEHLPFCILEISLDGNITSINHAGRGMIGVQNEAQVIGQSYLNLTEKRDHARIRKYFTEATQGQAVNFEFSVTIQGNVNFFTKSFIPIRGRDRKIEKIVGIAEDITERKLSEERLRESEAERLHALRQSDNLKSALLSSVSHELRTPLTAMKTTVSNIVGNGPIDMNEVQQGLLKGIDQEINYMSRLVDNLLDMSQIEAGTLIPHREWHPLEDLVEGALRRTEQSIETRDIEIHIPDDINPVFVDAVEIQQVLINLLDNANKYSLPDSPIRLRVHVDPEQIKIEVSNIAVVSKVL